jgi:hypothetical protein
MHGEEEAVAAEAGSLEPGNSRDLLVARLRAKWVDSGRLGMERIAVRLQDALKDQGVTGLSKSSVARYFNHRYAELPDPSVLTALATIFQATDEELTEWLQLRQQAKLAKDRTRYLRGVADASTADDPPGDGASSSSLPGEVTGQAETPAALPTGTAAQATTGSLPATEVSKDAKHSARFPDWWKMMGPLAAIAVLALTVTVGVPAISGHRRSTGPDLPPPKSTASPEYRATVPAASGAGSADGVEVGALGGDSRCSPPRTGPSGVRLRSCVRVESRQILFAAKVDNPATAPIKVTVQISYWAIDSQHSCRPGPAVSHLSVPAGKSYVTNPIQCTVPREPFRAAYQADALIAAGDSHDWTAHQLSPRANVYPDRVLWRCLNDLPC